VYKAFFGFQKNPFDSTPDPAFFFRSSHHEAALKGLLLSIEARMGAISLVGEKGTGKTVVLECLRNSLAPDIRCAFLRDSRISFGSLLETIASHLDLDVRFKKQSAAQVFLALTRLMAEQARSGSTVVLIVDEAHNLPADVFADIVHIASLNHDKAKEIQTVFAGRPELQPRLAALNPYRVKQRALLSGSLYPFTARETQEYVEFRLACAGMAKQTVFPREALAEIYDQSQGFAPAIHAVCEELLRAAFSASSRVCTQEIRDQVFKRPQGNRSHIVEATPTIVAAARIDRLRLAPPSAPEPPPMQTAFLRVPVDARPGSLRARPVNMDEGLVPLTAITLKMVFPRWRFMLAGTELPLGSTRPMAIRDCTKALALRPSLERGLAISSIPVRELFPCLPEAAAGEPRKLGAGQLSRGRLIPSERYVKRGPNPSGAPSHTNSFPATFSSAPQPRYPAASFQAASVVPGSPVPLPALRPTGYDKTQSGASRFVKVEPVNLIPDGRPIVQAPRASFQPSVWETNTPLPVRLSAQPIPPPVETPIHPVVSTLSTLHTSWSPATFSSALQPRYPAASFQAAGVVPCSSVPLPPLRARCDRPQSSASRFVEVEPVNLIPAGRPIVQAPRAALQPSVWETNTPLPVPLNAQPIPPPVETPSHSVLSALSTLQVRRPMSGLKPDRSRASLLPPPTWTQRGARPENPWASPVDTLSGITKQLRSHRNLLLTFVIPIVAALALYGAPPAMRAAADVSQQGWQRAQHAVLNRAAVALDEDFRAGLSNWMSRGGSAPHWARDASTFVRPGALALYRPSLGMVDYQMQFLGTIDKKGLSWVVRAADFNNYYAIRLTVLKPGPLPAIGVTRYAVINGIPQKSSTTPVLMRAQADTVYRVRLDLQGDQFALSIQDQPVDSWSESRLGHGAIGFFSEKDAGSRIANLQLRGHYDMLGRLCAFVMPSAISNPR
jgi:general secretion pathway protein A